MNCFQGKPIIILSLCDYTASPKNTIAFIASGALQAGLAQPAHPSMRNILPHRFISCCGDDDDDDDDDDGQSVPENDDPSLVWFNRHRSVLQLSCPRSAL